MLAVSGCGTAPTDQPEAEAPSLTRFTGTLDDSFDTTIDLIAYCESEEVFDRFLAYADREYLRYHQLYDVYHSYAGINNIKTVNDNAGVRPVEVDPDLIALLEYAVELYGITDGKMNVALGPVTRLWHDAREVSNQLPDMAYVPSGDELASAALHCSIDGIQIDSEKFTVFLSDPEGRIDLGAVAKGYATERVARGLQELGFSSFAINAGGNIKVVGSRNGGNWVAAITNPDRTSSEAYIGQVSVQDMTIVTSGSYQRFFACEGKTYHHIIDPVTLYPENRFLSVTVLAEDSGFADACSTALFNMDYEEGLAFAEANALDAMWVFADSSVSCTDGFQAVWSGN